MNKFKAQDRIKVAGVQNSYNYGTILDVLSYPDGTQKYHIDFDFAGKAYVLTEEGDALWEMVGPFLPQGVAATQSGTCTHDWKEYFGMRESFEFCQKCDEKKVRA